MKLGVNIDHIATLRQQRGGDHPDPLEAARICKRSGAHCVVMHLREDRRHIQDADLFRVRRYVPIRLNLEMAVMPSVTRVALRLRPDQVTLVPEKRRERTTESGLDLFRRTAVIRHFMRQCDKRGITVSLFIDPDARQVRKAAQLEASAIEIHTGAYAEAPGPKCAAELRKIRAAVDLGRKLGLKVHAGHGLDYDNVRAITGIRGIDELNIGYSIVTRAVWVGFEKAVRQMKTLIQ